MIETVGNLVESAAVVSCDADLHSAVETMRSQQCDRLYLTDREARVSSVVFDYTLLKAHIRGDLQNGSLSQYAAPLQNILSPDQPLAQAALLFRCGYQAELPVFESHQFLGVVRRRTLLSNLLSEPESAMEEAGHDADHPCSSDFPKSVFSAMRNQNSLPSQKTG